MLSEKGKYASATQNRRFVWAKIVWPLILEINDVAFSLKQYQQKRDQVCKEKKVTITITIKRISFINAKRDFIKRRRYLFNSFSINSIYEIKSRVRLCNCNYMKLG